MPEIEKAIAFALRAHEAQTRKESDMPYIVHPLAVALILARAGFENRVLIAAILHDVIEDTAVTSEELTEAFGREVAEIVTALSHDDTLPWKEKKSAYIECVRIATAEVKAVATADKIANAESLIAAHAKEGDRIWNYFNAGRDAKLWFEESMLAMLKETWDHPLVRAYEQCVETMKAL